MVSFIPGDSALEQPPNIWGSKNSNIRLCLQYAFHTMFLIGKVLVFIHPTILEHS